MRKWIGGAAVAVGMSLASGQAMAIDNLYGGGGLGLNSLSGWDNAIGYQFFGGYEMTELFGDVGTRVPELFISGEVGYMDSGKMERNYWWGRDDMRAQGVWTTGVGGYEFSEGFMVFGRAGLDFGDDDGVMVGGGVEYFFHGDLAVRGEYVIRDHINSIQGNLVYSPGR